MNVRFEWRPRHAFHEIAEALGVTTDHILSVAPIEDGHAVTVIFSEEHAPDPLDTPLFSCWMKPDADGVLVAGPRHPSGSVRDVLRLEG
jgi:hypothetical protein